MYYPFSTSRGSLPFDISSTEYAIPLDAYLAITLFGILMIWNPPCNCNESFPLRDDVKVLETQVGATKVPVKRKSLGSVNLKSIYITEDTKGTGSNLSK
jgi:hypothetical protein